MILSSSPTILPLFSEQTPVKDHTYLGRKYPSTFKSKSAIDFLLNANVASDENEAIEFCTTLIRYGMIANAGDRSLPQFVPGGHVSWF